MKRWLLSCSLLLMAPASAMPQTVQIQNEIQKELHQARVYQDIEIMLRLVQRRVAGFLNSCQKCHVPGPGERTVLLDDPSASARGYGEEGAMDKEVLSGKNVSGAFDTWVLGLTDGRAARIASSEAIVIDGHYLKGQGVIFVAQLPASLAMFTREPPAHPLKKPAQPINEWDLIRRQLWGEKVKTAKAPPDDPHQTTIQDVLLQVLADNGKHFQSLATNENLTLTVTFRNPPVDAAAQLLLGETLSRNMLQGWITSRGEGAGGDMAAGSGPMIGPGSQPAVGPGSSSKDYELLADFHLKQARYPEAVKTLQKALEVNKDANRAGSLYRKLASAYLLQDPGQGNPQTLAKASEYLKKAQESGKGAAQAPAQRLALPTRLVITASRSALQQTSPGNLEDFRRQVTVTWLRFDHPTLQQTVEPRTDPEKGGESSK